MGPGTLTAKVGGGTGANSGSIVKGKRQAGDVELDVGEGLDAPELII